MLVGSSASNTSVLSIWSPPGYDTDFFTGVRRPEPGLDPCLELGLESGAGEFGGRGVWPVWVKVMSSRSRGGMVSKVSVLRSLFEKKNKNKGNYTFIIN